MVAWYDYGSVFSILNTGSKRNARFCIFSLFQCRCSCRKPSIPAYLRLHRNLHQTKAAGEMVDRTPQFGVTTLPQFHGIFGMTAEWAVEKKQWLFVGKINPLLMTLFFWIKLPLKSKRSSPGSSENFANEVPMGSFLLVSGISFVPTWRLCSTP